MGVIGKVLRREAEIHIVIGLVPKGGLEPPRFAPPLLWQRVRLFMTPSPQMMDSPINPGDSIPIDPTVKPDLLEPSPIIYGQKAWNVGYLGEKSMALTGKGAFFG
jgi:hypothetical protein